MSWRAHSALWIAGIACALMIAPGDSRVAGAPTAIVARTESLLAACGAPLADAVHAQARRIEPAWMARLAEDRDGSTASRAHASGLQSWRAYGRAVVLRVAWLARMALACLPVVLAGLVDGIAMRRARRAGLAPGVPWACALGGHALVALAFAPFAWAALPMAGTMLAVPIWALLVAATLSFTLSRVAGVGAH